MRFEIRRKEYDFANAPDLTGQDAGYVPILMTEGAITKGLPCADAIDAARQAARMCEAVLAAGQISERCAFVGCEYSGERPPGAMKNYMYVSYRIKPNKHKRPIKIDGEIVGYRYIAARR